MKRTVVTENGKMQKYPRGKVKEKRLAGQHIRRGEGKLIKRMRNVFIAADKARCPFPQGARRFFFKSTLRFKLLSFACSLPLSLSLADQVTACSQAEGTIDFYCNPICSPHRLCLLKPTRWTHSCNSIFVRVEVLIQ